MTEDKREGILHKVRGLLAKANSTPFEAEAETFRKKADELMTQYAIETWQLEVENPESKRKPIRKDMDFSWYYQDDVGEQLWPMFLALVSHCRCVVANLNVRFSPNSGEATIPVFGTEEDVMYLNLLFTDLYIQFSNKLSPEFDSSKSRAENIYVAKEAGMSWKDIAHWIGEPELIKYRSDGTIGSISGSLKRDYRAWAAKTESEFHTSNPKSYIRSFAIGFAYGVSEQLRQMKGEQGQNTGSTALVLRDIRLAAEEEMHAVFPNQAKKQLVRGKQDSRKMDTTGLARGNAEGKNANITSKAGNRLKDTKQLNN